MQLRTRETVQFSSRNENVCVLRALAMKSVTTRDFLRYFENGCKLFNAKFLLLGCLMPVVWHTRDGGEGGTQAPKYAGSGRLSCLPGSRPLSQKIIVPVEGNVMIQLKEIINTVVRPCSQLHMTDSHFSFS